MKNLLYKEFLLNTTMQTVVSMLLPVLIIIPTWPSLVAFFYPLAGIFTILPFSLTNQDMLFTGLLPIKKSDIVKGKVYYLMAIELISILIAVPAGIVRQLVLTPLMPLESTYTELGINFATFGIVLMIYAFFNAIYIPWFYKKRDKQIAANVVSFVLTSILLMIFMVFFIICEPATLFLNDFTNIYSVLTQIGILLLGLIIFFLSGLFAIKKGGKNFSKIDL